MSSSCTNFDVKKSKIVLVNTTALKARLNTLYQSRRKSLNASNESMFAYLWDLKEMALMEGKSEVEVPATLLEDLEEAYKLEKSVHFH